MTALQLVDREYSCQVTHKSFLCKHNIWHKSGQKNTHTSQQHESAEPEAGIQTMRMIMKY